MENFLTNFHIHQLNCGTTEGVLAGAISSTGNPVDVSRLGGVVFIAGIEKVVTTTSGANLYLVASCSSNGTYAEVAGSAVQCGSSGTNFYLATELVDPHPDKKWVAAKVAVPATCSWVGHITAISYGKNNMPVTQPTCSYTNTIFSATSGTI